MNNADHDAISIETLQAAIGKPSDILARLAACQHVSIDPRRDRCLDCGMMLEPSNRVPSFDPSSGEYL